MLLRDGETVLFAVVVALAAVAATTASGHIHNRK